MTQLPLTPGAQPGSDGFRTVNPTAADAAVGKAQRIASISGNVAINEWYIPGLASGNEIDGGSANAMYLLEQSIDAGVANSIYLVSQTIDGGLA